METYRHKVQYYETDQMSFVHHSNYIRWFEEARIWFMEQIGVPYDAMEERGFISPVRTVDCKYLKPSRFGETEEVVVRLTEFGNVLYKFEYEVRQANTHELRAVGSSSHCFINREGRVISLKKEAPELFERLKGCVSKSTEGEK